MNSIIDDIALTFIPKVGPRTAAWLIDSFGSAAGVFSAGMSELITGAGLNEGIARAIIRKDSHKRAEKEIGFCKEHEIVPLAATSQAYPQLLKECGDHPHVIYYKGDLQAISRKSVSMVGTRSITQYGQRACELLVGELAELVPDVVIVSGLAFGVDGACHRAAMANGLVTVAVLPTPLDNVYPGQHRTLADEIVRRGGGLLTEYPSGSISKGTTFLARNRIIAGMSQGTVVVESAAEGGSMITAALAHGYNRSVMAVPGRITDNRSQGTNRLIVTERGRMVCSAEDILAELGWDMVPGCGRKAEVEIGGDAASLLSAIPEGGSATIDEIAEKTGMSVNEAMVAMMGLEFEGLVRLLPGKMYEKL